MSTVVDVRRDLTAIETMFAALLTEAVHHGDDPDIIGGDAMVQLANSASPGRWERRAELAEHAWVEQGAVAYVEGYAIRPADPTRPTFDEDDTWTPVLQALLFWTEAWREEHDAIYAGWVPTIASEINWIRHMLDWVWDNELHWDDFAGDIRDAKRKMENLLREGDRAARGAPCLYDECKGTRLVRKTIPTRGPNGEKTYRISDWHCPRCKKSYTETSYETMVAAGYAAAQEEVIEGVTWVSVQRAAAILGRSVKTIRTWIDREELTTACVVAGRRKPFVMLSEVERRHEEAKKPRGRATGAAACTVAFESIRSYTHARVS